MSRLLGASATLQIPRRLPVGSNLCVDWSHPLSRGLIGCYVPAVTFGTNLASPLANLTARSASNRALASTAEGPAILNVNGSTGGYDAIVPSGSPFLTWTSLTCYWRGNQIALASTGDTYCGILFNTAQSTPFEVATVGIQGGAAGKWSAQWNTAGTHTASTSISPTIGVMQSLCATFVVGGNVLTYMDAILQNTTSFGSSAPTNSSTSTMCVAGQLTFSTTIHCLTNVGYVWNRALSAQEITYLDRDPYCFLITEEMPALFTAPLIFVPFLAQDLSRHPPQLDTNQGRQPTYFNWTAAQLESAYWSQPPDLLRHPAQLDTNQPQLTFAALEKFATPTALGFWDQPPDLQNNPKAWQVNEPLYAPFDAIPGSTPSALAFWRQGEDLLRHAPQLDTNEPVVGKSTWEPGIWWWRQGEDLLKHVPQLDTNEPRLVSQQFATPASLAFWSEPPDLFKHWPTLDTNEPFVGRSTWQPGIWWWLQGQDLLMHPATLDTNQPRLISQQFAEPAIWWWRQGEDLLRHAPQLDTNEPQLTFAAQNAFATPVVFWWRQPDDLFKHWPTLDTNQGFDAAYIGWSAATPVVTPSAFWIFNPSDLLCHPSILDTNQSRLVSQQFATPASLAFWRQGEDLLHRAGCLDTNEPVVGSPYWEPGIFWWHQAEDLLRHAPCLDTNEPVVGKSTWEPGIWWWIEAPDLQCHPAQLDTNQPRLVSQQFATPSSFGFWRQGEDLLHHAGCLDTNEPVVGSPYWEPGIFWWRQGEDLLRHAPQLDTNESRLVSQQFAEPNIWWWRQGEDLLCHPRELWTPEQYVPIEQSFANQTPVIFWWKQPEDLLRHAPQLDTNQGLDDAYAVWSTQGTPTPSVFWWTQPPNLLNHLPTLDTNEPQQTFASLQTFATPTALAFWRQPEDLFKHWQTLDTNEPFVGRATWEPGIWWWRQGEDLLRHPTALDTNEPFVGRSTWQPGIWWWRQGEDLLSHPECLDTNEPFVGRSTWETGVLGFWRQGEDLLRHPTALDTNEPFVGRATWEPGIWWWIQAPDLLSNKGPVIEARQQFLFNPVGQTPGTLTGFWRQPEDLQRHWATLDTNLPQFGVTPPVITPKIWWWRQGEDLLKHPPELWANEPWISAAPTFKGLTPAVWWWTQAPDLLTHPNTLVPFGMMPFGIPPLAPIGRLAFGGLRFLIPQRKKLTPALGIERSLAPVGKKDVTPVQDTAPPMKLLFNEGLVLGGPRNLILRGTKTMSRAPDLQPPIVPGEQQFVTFDFGLALSGSAIIISVAAINISVVSGNDATPSARVLGPATIVNSPSMGTVGAVSQKFGTMLGGVTYLLQCLVNTSDGQILSLEAHWLCQTPS